MSVTIYHTTPQTSGRIDRFQSVIIQTLNDITALTDKMLGLTFIILESVALDSEPAFLNEDGLASSGSESPSPSIQNTKKSMNFEVFQEGEI